MTCRPLNRSMTACLLVALFLPAEAAAYVFTSETSHKTVHTTQTAKRMARCDQFKLKEVQGSSADARTYWFSGVCKIWIVKYVGGKEQGISDESSMWAEAKATWNAQSNRLDERVKLTDPGNQHSGTLELGFKCMQDPVVQKASCVRLHFKNLTDWTGFEVPVDKNSPMLAGRATQAEIAAVTKTAVPSVKRNAMASGDVATDPAALPMRAPLQMPTGSIGVPAPRPTLRAADPSASATTATRQASNLPAVQAPRLVDRELAALSCTAATDGLRFACTTRAGLERCEALRREQKVARCTLAERR